METLETLISLVKGYDSGADLDAISRAYKFAQEAHGEDKRKSGELYFIHPVATAHILAGMKADDTTIIAGLLHDVVEDTEVTLEDIEKHFGKEMVVIVDGLTKFSKVRYQGNPTARQVASLRKLLLNTVKDMRVVVVKLADRLHNMRTLEFVRPEKRWRIAKETLEIHAPLARLLGMWDMMRRLENLGLKYTEPEQYKLIKNRRDKLYSSLKKYFVKIENDIRQAANGEMDFEIYEDKKHIKEIHDDVSRVDMKSRIAVKIIVDTPLDCYRMLGIIHGLWHPRLADFRDYISMPKANGYESLHTSIFGPKGKRVEFHIRTQEMDDKAQNGVVARWYWDRVHGEKDEFKYSWVSEVKQLKKMSDGDNDFVDGLKGDVFEDRIFVYTEKGDTVDLPRGATIVDFAYAVCTNWGNKLEGAFVNKRYRNPLKRLRTGDVVSVQRSDNGAGPQLVWLDRVKTSRAKDKIRKYFAELGGDDKRGRESLEKVLRCFLGRHLSGEKKHLLKVADGDYTSLEDLVASVGRGKLSLLSFMEKFYGEEEVLGQKRSNGKYRIGIEVYGHDRPGLLNDISRLIANKGANIVSYSASVDSKTGFVEQDFMLDVDDFESLYRLFVDLWQVKEVVGVVCV